MVAFSAASPNEIRAAEDPAWEYRPSFEHGLALELAEGAAEQDEQEAPSKACVVM